MVACSWLGAVDQRSERLTCAGSRLVGRHNRSAGDRRRCASRARSVAADAA
jgi:hypothetical protein